MIFDVQDHILCHHMIGGMISPPEEYRNYPAYAFAAQVAIVAVNRINGKVRVLNVIAAHNAGRLINPNVAEGQIKGICAMGIGYALSEEFGIEHGRPTTTHLGQLGLPRAADTPDYRIIFVEDPEPLGPYGAKAISEAAAVPITPAVTNALADAVSSAREAVYAKRTATAGETSARGSGDDSC